MFAKIAHKEFIMTGIADFVREKFDGMLVFSDVHGDYDSIKRAYDYADSHNFFFMSLGDLVDRARKPYETIQFMHSVVSAQRGGLAMGNHDDKFYRHAKGNKVHFSGDARQTLVDVGADREQEFFRMYMEIMNDRVFSSVFHTFDDITVVHAAAHASMFLGLPNVTKSERARYLVGETNGERHPDGYPVRLYSWIDDIPAGKTVIVGHDRTPFDYSKVLTEPKEVTGKMGGRVLFVDTGGGKGGHVTGVVVRPGTDSKFEVVKYKQFK